MSACNIKEIISPNTATRGATEAASAYAGTKNQSDVNFFDSFVDSVNSITEIINNTNCSDKLKNIAKSKLSLNVAGVKINPVTVYDWAYDQVNLSAQLNNVASVANWATNGQASTLTSAFCVWAKNMSLYFETILQAGLAFVIPLFQKIQKYKEKLEQAMIQFTDSISGCLITVVNDARNAANKLIDKATDFGVLVDLMNSCSCIKGIIKNISGCQTDDNGNPLNDAQAIVDCIQKKLNINPSQWITSINKFIDNTIIGGINNVHDSITDGIRVIMDLLYTPIRALARMYCNLIETKVDVSFLVKKSGDMRCLLVYTKEIRKDGSSYFGMNIYDILATMQLWLNCLSPICKSFSDDIANGIKNWRDEYKMNTKYWNDVFTADIRAACNAFRNEDRRAKTTTLREIYYRNEKTSKKNFFSVIDFMRSVGIVKGPDNNPSNQTYTSTASAVNFNQFPIPNTPYNAAGTYKFFPGIDDNITSIVQGLAISTNIDFYFQKYQSLVIWAGKYIKSQTLIDSMQSIDTNAGARNSVITTVNTNSNQDSFLGDEIPEEIFVVPTYKVINDYDSNEVNTIEVSAVPPRNLGETLSSYYARWYNSLGV